MMGLYQNDRVWSDQFLPQLRGLIGPHLLVASSLEQDTTQATDLLVLTARDMRIACRVRRAGYATKYPRQFTIRSHRDSGAETEFAKVMSGWGDWMFYGHATGRDIEISPWWLIDLMAFRKHWADFSAGKSTLWHQRNSNPDGTHFHAFHVDRFPISPPILIAESSHPWPARGRVAQWPRSGSTKSGQSGKVVAPHESEIRW